MTLSPHSALHYLYGKPSSSAVFKQQPDDFIVDEILGIELTGEGEHVCLNIVKQGINTQQVAKKLASFANVALRDVSYAGLKDRHGVCSQWFSVPVAIKKELDFSQLNDEHMFVTKQVRHNRKLRIGCHQGNHFTIRLREVRQPLDVLCRINAIAQGVPNYFGEQRFGHDEHNLALAERMFAGEKIRDKKLRSLVISAARSYVFNQIVSLRVREHGLAKTMHHEVFLLNGSNAFFNSDISPDTLTRLREGDIHLSAPLIGQGEKGLTEQEKHWLEPYQTWQQQLGALGLKNERRALRLYPENLTVTQPKDDIITLQFGLAKGTFATSVLRELVNYSQPHHANYSTKESHENTAQQ